MAAITGAMVKKMILPVAGDIYGFKMDYKYAREKGDSKAVSVAKGVGTAIFYDMMGPAAWAYMGVTIGTSLVGGWAGNTTNKMKKSYQMKGKLGSGSFNMQEAGYTMRQRSINAIRMNGQNIQSALGNEARNYYRT